MVGKLVAVGVTPCQCLQCSLVIHAYEEVAWGPIRRCNKEQALLDGMKLSVKDLCLGCGVWFCGCHFAVFSFDFLHDAPYRLPPLLSFQPLLIASPNLR